jgi:acyl-CoA-binding protein
MDRIVIGSARADVVWRRRRLRGSAWRRAAAGVVRFVPFARFARRRFWRLRILALLAHSAHLAPFEYALGPKATRNCYDRRPILTRPRPAGAATMTDLDTRFAQAHEEVQQLPERPGNLTLLRLYALSKQATRGDVHGEKPGFTDIVGKYKYDAWAALKGTEQDVAKQQYIELVESLKSGAAA